MKKKTKERKTTMELSGNDLPELRDVHVDDVITVTLTLKATRITEGGYMYEFCDDEDCEDCDPKENKKKVSGSFQVQSAKFVNKKSAEDESPEASKASKFNKYRKEGKSVAAARSLAGM
jgi:hypothetical protein